MNLLFNIILISSWQLLMAAEYSYENADQWKNEYPTCDGPRQSPMNIDFTLDPDQYDHANDVKFVNIFTTVPERMVLKNDGHTLKILFDWPDDEESLPHVIGGPLKNKYITHSFNFRWGTGGADNYSGSEHTVNGINYAMEMQVVHYSDKFNSYEEAENVTNGLMINSFFIVLGSEGFDFLTFIADKIDDVRMPEGEIELEPFALGDYFKKKEEYHHIIYFGSLTHPPCYESVVWIITYLAIPATQEQVKAFHNLVLYQNDDHNNRPIQERNDRHLIFAE